MPAAPPRSRAPHAPAVAALAARAALAAPLLLAGACGPRDDSPLGRLAAGVRPSGVKVLLIGIDGATFSVLDPLVASGQAPNFQRLLERGSRGVLRSFKPSRSPALWTTVATGRPPRVHGITHFHLPRGSDGDRELVTSADRRSPALWNLMEPFGLSVGFAGWWATWPAEPVAGWLVSDRMARGRWTEWTDGNRQTALTHPPELAARLRPLVIDPMRPPLAEIRRLVELSPAELEEMDAVQTPIYAHGLSVFKFSFSAQRSFEEMTLALLADGQPDLTAVFLVATDPISHTFWHYYEPERFAGVDAAAARRLGELVPGIYRHNDRFLGRLLERIDPETVVLVVSDHGFRASGKLPRRQASEGFAEWFDAARREAMAGGTVAVGQSGAHSLEGLLVAAGGPVAAGAETEATLFDLAPTVLALMGLPVAEEMEGRVLEEIVEPEFWRRHPIRRIPSYAEHFRPFRPEIEGRAEDSEMMDLLRSLGYIG